MRLRQRLGLRAGIAIVASSSVLLGVVLHRTYTALFGHHIALAVLPLALVGAGLGGVAAHLSPGIARPPKLLAHLGYLATLAAFASLASLLLVLHVKPVDVLDKGPPTRLAILGVAATLPFFFAGFTLAATFRHAARDLGRLGFTVLAAAGVTGPVAVAALRIGAPRAALLAMALDAVAALAFYLAARAHEGSSPMPRVPGQLVATVMLASTALIAGDLGAPWVKTPALRWAPFEKTELREWTVTGLRTVDKAHGGTAMIRTDGTYASPMLEGRLPIPVSPDDLPYVRRRDASPVLVLGAVGGRDVRVAQKHTQKEIHAVDDGAFVLRAWVRDHYKKWNGGFLDKPEVTVAVDDPRGYLRRTTQRFRTIVFALTDAQVPAGLGALAGERAELYTVEAVRDALDRLTPDGAVLLSRWGVETDRALALAMAGLRAAGIADPGAHVFACSNGRSTGLLLTRSALSSREIATIRNHCRRNKLNEAFAPDQTHGDLRRRIATEANVVATMRGAVVDLSPPTDDRPHFFATVPRSMLASALRHPPALRANGLALFVIASATMFSAAALALALVLPAAMRRPRERERGARLPSLAFFASAGAGAALAAAGLSARLPVLLGHPGHALTTVQVAMLAFAAGGCLVAARQPTIFAARGAGYRAQALVALLAVAAVAMGPFVERAIGLPIAARLALSVVALAPFGLLFGGLLALGIKAVAARTPELVPWTLGAGALAAAVASAAGLLVAMALGTSAVLLAAGAACLVAAISVPRG